MKQLPWIFALVFLSVAPLSAGCPRMTNEHSDFYFSYSEEKGLELHFRDTDRGRLYKGGELLLMVPEAARLFLPPGTPFGEEGAPIWILPQSQNPDLLYLGLAADDLPSTIFAGAVHLRLTTVSGPGHFFAWQAGVHGLDVKMNSSDGISAEDMIAVPAQSHAHVNWGFSSPGIYRITFEVEAAGVGGPILSEPSTFEFHVLPLQGYQHWQSLQFSCPGDLSHPSADPDHDGLANLAEYAFGKKPMDADGPHSILLLSWGEQDGQTHPVLEYRRSKAASDVVISVLASNHLDDDWAPLASSSEVIDDGDFEIVRTMDSASRPPQQTRFYRLRLELQSEP